MPSSGVSGGTPFFGLARSRLHAVCRAYELLFFRWLLIMPDSYLQRQMLLITWHLQIWMRPVRQKWEDKVLSHEIRGWLEHLQQVAVICTGCCTQHLTAAFQDLRHLQQSASCLSSLFAAVCNAWRGSHPSTSSLQEVMPSNSKAGKNSAARERST